MTQYIYEAINAGRELLGICINELYPEDILQYLPSRYLLWFQYAAVFLLKVSFPPFSQLGKQLGLMAAFGYRRFTPVLWSNPTMLRKLSLALPYDGLQTTYRT